LLYDKTFKKAEKEKVMFFLIFRESSIDIREKVNREIFFVYRVAIRWSKTKTISIIFTKGRIFFFLCPTIYFQSFLLSRRGIDLVPMKFANYIPERNIKVCNESSFFSQTDMFCY